MRWISSYPARTYLRDGGDYFEKKSTSQSQFLEGFMIIVISLVEGGQGLDDNDCSPEGKQTQRVKVTKQEGNEWMDLRAGSSYSLKGRPLNSMTSNKTWVQ